MTAPEKQPSARTKATRAKIISTAEQLFAEKGVASVSLNEITRAAEQKNRNAVHYHFGNKEALVQAIFEKHWAPISAQRTAMIDAIEHSGDIQLQDVASVLVRPVAARFDEADGGVAYIKISAQLAAANVLNFFHPGEDASPSPDYGPNMNQLWAPFLRHLPRPVREQRMSLIVGMLFHGLADHAVFRDSGDTDLANTELMVSNLIDSLCAVLSAPVSAATEATL
ncbi:MAG: TetR/AcrR family transcriptional regulator [Lysobacterales bacterium]